MVTLSEATLRNLLSKMFISYAATLCSKTNVVIFQELKFQWGGGGCMVAYFLPNLGISTKVFIPGEWKYGYFS
jgi:fructose-1-phosphate kinase PfkB-like protein